MRIRLLLLFMLLAGLISAQIELVPPSHPVYDFVKRMQMKEVITGYNSAVIPVSREKVAAYLKETDKNSKLISQTDKKILEDYKTEFEYDLHRTLKNTSDFFAFDSFDLFKDNKQKYL